MAGFSSSGTTRPWYTGLYHGSPGFMAAYEETSVLPATKSPYSKIQKFVSQFKSSYLQYSIPVVTTTTSTPAM